MMYLHIDQNQVYTRYNIPFQKANISLMGK